MATKKEEQQKSGAAEEWRGEDNIWYQKARQTAEDLLDRPAFSYNPNADPLYQAAKNQYVQQGKQAMEDTMGKAAALSGGYASSYAQTMGTQAYQAQLARLSELLPDYYDRARSAYDRETDAMQDALGTALGLYDKDYQAWLDRQDALERKAAADVSKDQWERKFAEDSRRWEAEYAQEAEKWAAQQAASAASQARSDKSTERSYAYRMAMVALQQGLSVSDALLKTAGINKAYAETIRRYYYNLRRK